MPDFIDLRGIRTAYDAAGNGPPLLMLHGAEGSRRQFEAVRPHLADRYTVITYDQRDCGETTGAVQPATLTELADDAAALLEALGHGSAFVFGTSFGGRVAQALAVRHPARIRRLVLAHTWPLAVSIGEANPEVAGQIARLRAELPASAEALAALFHPPAFLESDPAARAHFKAAPPRSARSERRAAAVEDRPALDVRTIAQPTLLIAGELDRVVPMALTLSLAGQLRDSRAVVLPGVGHLSLAQVPEVVAAHVRTFCA